MAASYSQIVPGERENGKEGGRKGGDKIGRAIFSF